MTRSRYAVTCVSMGNPHAVVFVPDLDALPFDTVGPLFECASVFPKKINTEFVQVLSRGEPPPPLLPWRTPPCIHPPRGHLGDCCAAPLN
jgi:hypothetical protein